MPDKEKDYVKPAFLAGNARAIGAKHRGWFAGSFVQEVAQMSGGAIELKWGEHLAGQAREAWASSPMISCSILFSGRFRLQFRDGETLLAAPGDFVLWQPGVEHKWLAEEDSVILTVRWPPSQSAPPEP